LINAEPPMVVFRISLYNKGEKKAEKGRKRHVEVGW